MLALVVVDVGNVEVTIHVAVAVGDLGADVHVLTGADFGVQLILDGVDLVGGQEVQGRNIVVVGHAQLFGRLREGVLKALAGEGLVILVDTGVDHRESAARAGVTGSPGQVRAGHVGRAAVVGLVNRLIDLRLVAVLQEHVLDALDALDGVDLAVLNVRGDVVCRQRQVPLNVQLAADRIFDLGGHSCLVGAEACAVDPCQRVVRNAIGAEAGRQRGGPIQRNGHTDNVGQRMIFLVDGFFLLGFLTELERTQFTGVDGRERKRSTLRRLDRRCTGHGDQEGAEQGNHKGHRQDPAEQRCVLHCHVSFDKNILYRPLCSRERKIYGLGPKKGANAPENSLSGGIAQNR